MIEVKSVSKRFGKLLALDAISLSMDKGECIALIGPNGCGKTTLIKNILGMVLPDSGDIVFKGKSIDKDIEYRRNIGYMPQIGRYPENMTIGQVIDMVKGIRHNETELDMELFQNFEIDKFIDKKMSTLSGGTTQKVSATLAFLFNPEVLILDEPTAGLDPIASEILKEKIIKEKNKGKLIIITSHILSELDEMVSQVVFIQEGKLIFQKGVDEIKMESNTDKISKAIVHLLRKTAQI